VVPTTGSLVGWFGPPPGFDEVNGVDYNEGAPARPLWIFQDKYPGPDLVANVTTAGSIVSTFLHNEYYHRPSGIAYDRDTTGGPFLYLATRRYNADLIFVYRPSSGSLISSFKVDTYPGTIGDLSWDGRYIWCLGTLYPPYLPGYVCRVVAQEYPSVAPASLGRVKALFR